MSEKTTLCIYTVWVGLFPCTNRRVEYHQVYLTLTAAIADAVQYAENVSLTYCDHALPDEVRTKIENTLRGNGTFVLKDSDKPARFKPYVFIILDEPLY